MPPVSKMRSTIGIALALIAVAPAAAAEPPPAIAELFAAALGHLQTGEAAAALEPARLCWELQQQHLDPRAPDATACAVLLVNVHRALGDLDAARELAAIVFDHLTDAVGAEHELTAGAASALAQLHWQLGDPDRAIPLYQAALATFDRAGDPDDPEALMTASFLALALGDAGRPAEAVPLARRVVLSFERLLGPDHEETATYRHQLAGLLYEIGEWDEAGREFERTLAVREEKLGPIDPLTGVTLNNFGLLLRDRGDFSRARAYLERSLSISERNPLTPPEELGKSYDNLATLLHAVGDFESALERADRAVETLETAAGPTSIQAAIARSNRASILQQLGRRSEARSEFEAVLPILDAQPDGSYAAQVLNNLAALDWLEGSEQKALARAREAASRQVAEQGLDDPDSDIARMNLATLLADSGDFEAARALYQDVLAAQTARGAALARVSQVNLAILAQRTGDLDGALDALEKSLESEEALLIDVLSQGTDAEKRLFLEQGRSTANWAVDLHLLHRSDDPRAARIALSAILRRKGRPLDVEAAARSLFHDGLGVQARDIQKRLADLRARRARLDSSERKHRRDIAIVDAAIERMAGDLSELVPVERTSVTVEQVTRGLGRGTALVEFVGYWPVDFEAAPGRRHGTRRYAAYVLDALGGVRAVDLGPADVIDEAALAFAESVGNIRHDVRALGAALSRLAFEPLRPFLEDRTRLLIAPDGVLHLVPFAALVDEDGRYLVETFEITLLTSGRDLARRTESRPQSAPLLMGGIDFGEGGGTTDGDPLGAVSFAELPGTAGEVREISALMAALGPVTLAGAEASEAALRTARAPAVLHLATHGFFLATDTVAPPPPPDAPPRADGRSFDSLTASGLALAGFNERGSREDGTDDGVLTALEMLDLDLAGTEIVALSACETGKGEVRDGQGVFGLRRALLLAGSRSQLTTLWQIDDVATRELMASWYRQLMSGAGRAEALRSVQLAALSGEALPGGAGVLSRGSTRLGLGSEDPELEGTRHPYYWAGFVLSGDAGPVPALQPRR